MILPITAAIAGLLLAVLALTLAVIAITVRAEDRRARGIVTPPADPLTALVRRLTGLHVRTPVHSCGPGCPSHAPTHAASDPNHHWR